MNLIPTVITSDGRTERAYDIYSRLLRDGVIFVRGVIDDDLASAVTAQLLFLENEAPERDIHVYLNSPGGSLTAALSIYDAMQYVKPDVGTVCLGMGMSAAAMIFMRWTKQVSSIRCLPRRRDHERRRAFEL